MNSCGNVSWPCGSVPPPWAWLPPGLMIALAVLSINFIGDGLRDALDPYLMNR